MFPRMSRKGTTSKCHQVRRLEAELHPAVAACKNDRRAITHVMDRHGLGMAGEAIALMALETFFRRSRGIKPDEMLLGAALDNVMREQNAHAFLPNRQNIRRLIPMARHIVANRIQPRPWKTVPAAGA